MANRFLVILLDNRRASLQLGGRLGGLLLGRPTACKAVLLSAPVRVLVLILVDPVGQVSGFDAVIPLGPTL